MQNGLRHLIVPALASWIGVAACAGAPMAPMEYSKPPAKADQASPPLPAAEVVQAPPPAPPPPVQLVPVARERTMDAAPALRVKAPSNGKNTHASPLLLKLAAHPWLEAHDAERLWVRFDDGGLIEIPASSAPIDLDALLSQNKLPALIAGPHVLRVLATTSVGASMAEGTPSAIVRFNAGTGTGTDKTIPSAGPRLTLLATEHCYAPNARIPLDFYAHDVMLSSEGTRIRYVLDDTTTGDITEASPLAFENVPVGDHALVLTFVGADGQPVSAAEPPARWTFTVAENCAAPTAPAPAAVP